MKVTNATENRTSLTWETNHVPDIICCTELANEHPTVSTTDTEWRAELLQWETNTRFLHTQVDKSGMQRNKGKSNFGKKKNESILLPVSNEYSSGI
jgi:uncharacterized membrane protein YfhO